MIGMLVGPATVRGTGAAAIDPETASAALAGIDDDITLLGEMPVEVSSLWQNMFQSAAGDDSEPMLLICPSWWSPQRVELVSKAAGGAAMARRSTQLARCAAGRPIVVVEIAPDLVAVSRRRGDGDDSRPASVVSRGDLGPEAVAESTARAVASTCEPGSAVVIDAPDGVGGAAALAEMVRARVRALGIATVTVVGDDRLLRAAVNLSTDESQSPAAFPQHDRPRTRRRLIAASVAAVAVATVAATAFTAGRGDGYPSDPIPMTTLVEGRVAVSVPAQWEVQRITKGPGSARVQISSPTDHDAAIHVTQSPIPGGEALDRTAATLRQALAEQPPGVFVDFNPTDRRGTRQAVTYREIRPSHEIRWTVLLAAPIRVSVGCQSASGREEAVRYPCEQAVASARALT